MSDRVNDYAERFRKRLDDAFTFDRLAPFELDLEYLLDVYEAAQVFLEDPDATTAERLPYLLSNPPSDTDDFEQLNRAEREARVERAAMERRILQAGAQVAKETGIPGLVYELDEER